MPRVYLLRSCEPALAKAREVIAGMTGWQLAGEAQRIGEASASLPFIQPDVLACDLSFADGRIDRLAQQCRFWPRRPRMLLLSDAVSDFHLFDALRWGAHGYCVTRGDDRDLEMGLRRLAAGRAAMSPGIAQRSLALFGLARSRSQDSLRASAAADQNAGGFAPGLARCDQHLMSLLASGMLVSEIAGHWKLDEVEIERRLAAIYGRMHELITHTEPERMMA